MNVSELLAKALQQKGIRYIFGLPGEENLTFIEALRSNGNFNIILTRHEQAAGFMAATCGRMGQEIAVAFSTLGAGATNLVTAVAHAYTGGFPMIVITGQKPFRDNMQGRYQLLDVHDIMRPITKFSATIDSPSKAGVIIQDAYHTALEGRPGPVHIELPEDIALECTNGVLLPYHQASTPIVPEESIRIASSMIEKAKRPLIMIGNAGHQSGVPVALREFIEKTGIPFFMTMLGKGIVDERHPLYLGTCTMPNVDYTGVAIQESDLIINIGHDIMEKPAFIMKTESDQQAIHINTFPAIADNIYFPQLQCVGDIAQTLQSINAIIEPQKSWDFTSFTQLADKSRQSVLASGDDTAFPVKPQFIVNQVRSSLDDDAIVSVDNGVHKLWFTRNFPVYHPNGLIIDSALGSMGPGLPAAIAAKLLYPDQQVLAVCGDGGFMMNSQEIETAIRLKLDIVVMIFNDHGLGMIRMKQSMDGHQNVAVDFNNPNFVKYAESFGAHGHFIDKPDDFNEIFKHTLNCGGVHIIDVPIDYRENNTLLGEMKAAIKKTGKVTA